MDKQTALSAIQTAISNGNAQGVIDTLTSFTVSNSTEYFTLDELENFVSDLPASVNGAQVALTYSGNIGEQSYKLAQTIATNSNGAVAIIDNTQAFKLLDSGAFESAINTALSKPENINISGIDAQTYIWGNGSQTGIINDLSYDFARTNDIPTRSLVATASDTGVWAVSEVQGFLDGNSPSVEGLSRNLVTTIYNDSYAEAFADTNDAVFAKEYALKETQQVIKAQAFENGTEKLHWITDGDGDITNVYGGGGTWDSVPGVNSGDGLLLTGEEVHRGIGIDDISDEFSIDITQGANKLLKYVDDVSKLADHPVLVALQVRSVITLSAKLYADSLVAEANGDATLAESLKTQSYQEISGFGGEVIGGFVGGFYGAAAGASAATAATAWLNLAGPAGTVANVTFGLIGGLAGAVVGGEVVKQNVEYITEKLSTFTTEEGRQGLADDYLWALHNPGAIAAQLVEELQEAIYGATAEEALKPSTMPDYDEIHEGVEIKVLKDNVNAITKFEMLDHGTIRVQSDGSGYLDYTDQASGIRYKFTIDTDGQMYFSTTKNLFISDEVNLFHALDAETRGDLRTFFNLVQQDETALNNFLATLPTAQAQVLADVLNNFSGGELFPAVKGFDSDAGDEVLHESDTIYDESEITVTSGYDGTAGAGFHGNTFGAAGDQYTNSDLFELVRSSDSDISTKAFTTLYNRSVENGNYSGPGGNIELIVPEGGHFEFINQGNGLQTLVLYNSDGELIASISKDAVTNNLGVYEIEAFVNYDEQGNTNVRTLMHDTNTGNVAFKEHVVADDYFDTLQGVVTDFASDYFAEKFADGNRIEKLLYQSAFRTISKNFDTFTSLLELGVDADEIVNKIATGGDIDLPDGNTTTIHYSLAQDAFYTFTNLAQAAVASLIVEEIAETIEIDGFAGEVFSVVGEYVTAQFVGQGFDFVFQNLDGEFFGNIFDGSFDFDQIDFNPAAVLAKFAAAKLAGELIAPESEVAGIMGSLGSSIGAFIGGSQAIIGALAGPVGIAIGAFIGQVAGTGIGNAFGGEDHPSAFGAIRYDYDNDTFYTKFITTNDGGPAELAESMAAQVSAGVNSILESTGGALRHTSVAEALQIGIREGVFTVDILDGATHTFGSAGDAVEFAAFHILKSHDLVGGSAVVMRAWHNTEATNMAEWREDIEVAEAFQQYLLNPTGILALMMDQPESELAQSWAAILQRAAELELHLPHEKDLDGGWNELLLARGDHDPGSIPTIEGDSIVLTDPVTGEETVLHHVIGPGYEIVRIEGTDGDDIIQVIVDGSSITYVDAGAGNDTVEGSDERDIILGGAGDDTINGNDGDDWINGGSGDDTLHGNGGLDLLYGGDDNDTLYGDEDGDAVYGGQGDDTLYGLDGADELFGGAGDDTLDGGDGVDLVKGEAGNDILISNGGGDTLDGGLGDDTYYLNGSGDTITITRESGHEIIYGNSLGSNAIQFDVTIGLYEIWFEAFGDDLVIKILGEDQSITVKDLFAAQDPSRFTFEWTNQFSLTGSNGLHDSSSQVYTIAQANAAYAGKPTGQYNEMSNADFDGSAYDTISWSNLKSDPRIFGDDGSNGYTFIQTGGGGGTFFFGGAGGDYTNAIDSDSITRNDYVYGDSGNDDLETGYGDDIVVGGLGNDTIRSNHDDDRVWGGAGDDTIYGGGGEDLIYGGIGNDTIQSGEQDDIVYGGLGDDTIRNWRGNDYIYGESGNDTIIIEYHSDNYIDGGADDDVITANSGDDTIFGGAGDDTIDAGAGEDFIDGGDGDDRLIYKYAENIGDHDEYIGGEGNDTLVINLTAAEFALDAMQRDLLRFEARINSNINTTTSTFLAFAFALQALGLSSVEAMEVVVDGVVTDIGYVDTVGTITTGETLSGSASHDHLIGLDGNDTINGGAGHDFLEGGAGDDIINGEDGSDDISGGAGDDTISGGAGDDTINGNAGDDNISGGVGADIISGGDGADTVDGGTEGDIIYGGHGDDSLEGGDGDDELYGESGNDTLSGGAGNDLLNGDTGNDRLIGSAGDDYLDGGIGDDEYVFNIDDGHDTINDVSGTGDFIRFGAGILRSDISVNVMADKSFELTIAQSATDLITIENQGTTEAPRLSVEKLVFDNGEEYNLALDIQADSAEVYRNGEVTIDVLANDSDILQTLLNVESVMQAEHGGVVLNADGTITYTPEHGYYGDDLFTYSATDWFGNLQTAEVSVYVRQGEYIADGSMNTSTLDALPTMNGYTSSEGTLTFSGEWIDGDGVSIYYNAWKTMNDVSSTSANPWSDSWNNDEWIGFEFNDAKVINKYTLTAAGYASYAPSYAPKDWSLEASNDGVNWVALDSQTGITGWGMFEKKTFTFTNDEYYTHYRLDIDNNNYNNTTSVLLDEWELVEAQIGELAPVALDDSFNGDEDTVITGNVLADNGAGADHDIENDTIFVQAETITTAAGAVVVISANGDFTYTSLADANGSDSFEYTLIDEYGGVSQGIVNITLDNVNDAPVIDVNGVEMVINTDVVLTTSMLTATDIDNIAADLVFTLDALPANGVLTLDGQVLIVDDSFTLQDIADGLVVFTPNISYDGSDSFAVSLSDGEVTLTSEVVDILVNSNAAPVLSGVISTIEYDGSYVIADGSMNTSTLDALPTMTGYTSSEGALTFSSEWIGGDGGKVYNPWKAMNDTTVSGVNPWLDSWDGDEWIAFEFNESKIINKYTLTAPGYYSGAYQYAPKDWNLEASNDGLNWVTLDAHVNEVSWSNHEKRTFSFVNDEAYTHYRLDINGNYYGDGASYSAGIDEWELIEAQEVSSGGAMLIDPDITLSDIGDISGAEIRLSGAVNSVSEEVLAVDLPLGVTSIYDVDGDDYVLNITGVASAMEYEQILESLTYQNTASVSGGTSRIVSITVTDASGLETQTHSIDITIPLPTIHGTNSGESLYGTSDAEILYGYGGTDTLYGYGGDDILDGGAGYSTYQGGAGDDTYIWDPLNGNVLLFEDTVTGDLGYDVIRIHGMNIDEITPQLYNGNEDLLVYNDDNSNYLRVAYQYYTETRGGDFDARKVEKIILDDGSEIEVSSRYSFTYKGADGDDTITSGSMSDTLIGGAGDDTLYGGGGTDIFVFDSFMGIDTVGDFNTSQGDKIDIADLLSGYDPLSDAISDFVQITDDGTNSTIAVDADGGADNYVTVATLLNAAGLTNEDALESSGTLITV